MSKQSRAEEEHQATVLNQPPPSTPPSEEPYSIFDKRQKAIIVLIASTAATFSGFASNIYFPAIPTIAADLHVSVEAINLTVTSYLIFQGLAPSLWGPISDVKGRRVAYCCTFVVFLGACIGLALSRNYAALVVLRCIQSTGSASTIAIGSGVIGDITTRAERGGFMGIFQAGLLAPVAIGPVIGGAMAGSLGWRAIFWFLTIYAGVFLLLLIIILPETLRLLVANGSRVPNSTIAKYPLSIYQKHTSTQHHQQQQPASPSPAPVKPRLDVLAPLRILTSKTAAPIILFLAVYYAIWQMSITAMSSLFSSRYHLSTTHIGLTFLANGVGSIIGTLTTGALLDADYRRLQTAWAAAAESNTNTTTAESQTDNFFPLEKARLRTLPVLALVQSASILAFAWSIAFPTRVHIAVPIASTFVTGWTAVSMQSAVMTYLLDVFHGQSAAASASLNLARCLMAAAGTSAVMPLINAIGVGWAFTVCVGVMGVGAVGLGVQWRYAGRWRQAEEVKD